MAYHRNDMQIVAAIFFILFLVLPPVLWTMHHRQPEVIGSGFVFLVCVIGGWALLYFGEGLDAQATGRSGGYGQVALMFIGAPLATAYCVVWLIVIKVFFAIRDRMRRDTRG